MDTYRRMRENTGHRRLCEAVMFGFLLIAWLLFPVHGLGDDLMTASGRGNEYVTELSEGWQFGTSGEDPYGNQQDISWTDVSLPHTWNVLDGADGDNRYGRSVHWYKKDIVIASVPEGKRYYLEFLGVNQEADLYVNDEHILLSGSDEYTHKGGYTAFRYDITGALRNGGNQILVRVDNSRSEEIAPISGDFNIYGGIYRQVFLITVDDIHVDLSDHGSSGLFLTTPNIRSKEKPENFGQLNIRANIVNEGDTGRKVTITAHIEGDNAPDDIVREVSIPSHGNYSFSEDTFVREPHLWEGIRYSEEDESRETGYLYRVTITISENGETIDAMSDTMGFRYIYADRDTGFCLNGESHPLHGVNRHQFKEGLGSALRAADHEEDIRLIMELGANTVRLSHYPQADYFYDLCDRNGIVVWTEIPLVNALGKAETFKSTIKGQLVELIRQQYNRPSVCFWGLENEVKAEGRNEFCTEKELFFELDNLAHEEDPSGRYTTQAANQGKVTDGNDPALLEDVTGESGWKSDLIAWNVYPGWYRGGSIEGEIEGKMKQDSRPMALSEYGYGASVTQHELYPKLGVNDLNPTGHWHPEEYQSLMHEEAIKSISEHQNLWATYVWCMFDFDVDARNEGSRAGQNDKGLVTNDRRIKKDSFYLYKANWNKREPFVHIASARFQERGFQSTYVKVYSNCSRVDLYLNDSFLGTMTDMGHGIFLTEEVSLEMGENTLFVVGDPDGANCTDACQWTRVASGSTELESGTLAIDNEACMIYLPRMMTVAEVLENLHGVENVTIKMKQNEGEVSDKDRIVKSQMTVEVLSENGQNRQEYAIALDSAFPWQSVRVSSTENGHDAEDALDGNHDTRWTAVDKSYPQMLELTLVENAFLDQLSFEWFTKNNRSYAYVVEVSEDGENYTPVIDREENSIIGKIMDRFDEIKGKCIRVRILSCSDPNGYAAICEMRVRGWSLSSQVYEVDHDNRLIIVPDLNGLTPEDFYANLNLQGDCMQMILPMKEMIEEGDQIILMGFDGKEINYTVHRR